VTIAFNVVLFQLGWFACVLGAANDLPALGPIVVLGVVAWHLLSSKQPGAEFALVVAAVVIGALFETLLVWGGWTRFENGVPAAGLPALWMIAMWPLFATTLNVSLRWMRGRPVLAALFGLIGGPLAYFGGAQLGALELATLSVALTVIGLGWALLTPALLLLASRLDRRPQGEPCA